MKFIYLRELGRSLFLCTSMDKTRGWLQELRFAKRQQLTVAIATVTWLAAIYAGAQSLGGLQQFERAVLSFLALIIAGPGIYVLFSRHVNNRRKEPKAPDISAWRATFTFALAIVCVAAFVIYSIWR